MSKKLKAMVVQAGTTQREVCRKLGWYEEKLSRLINGKQLPTSEDITALAGVLGKSIKQVASCFTQRR